MNKKEQLFREYEAIFDRFTEVKRIRKKDY